MWSLEFRVQDVGRKGGSLRLDFEVASSTENLHETSRILGYDTKGVCRSFSYHLEADFWVQIAFLKTMPLKGHMAPVLVTPECCDAAEISRVPLWLSSSWDRVAMQRGECAGNMGCYLTQSVFEVVFQKSTLPQIRQLVLYYY